MKVGSLFSGIGGLDLGLERAGMEVVWQVEIDEWCQRVLAKHWPNIPRHGDIRELAGDELEGVDLICGGFPCQSVSVAGQRRGTDDPRWLWPEMARLVRVLRPRFILVENVPGLLPRGFGDVLGDLAKSGYDAEWESLPAAALGAPHLRDRIFIVAHAQEQPLGAGLREGGPAIFRRRRFGDGGESVYDPDGNNGTEGSERTPGQGGHSRIAGRRDGRLAAGKHWTVEPDVGRVADGVPGRVDRLRGLGNAVVPQVAEWIGRRIMTVEAS